MSGGVDSSVAAALLHEQGHDLVGVTMHLWDASGSEQVGRCCAPEDREDARRTCDHLGIPHYVIDERAAFAAEVVDPLVDGYLAGRTPSPCVTCNQSVKLGRLLAVARELDATKVATGHYARVELASIANESSATRLHRGFDRDKDQSYFLFGVSHEVLSQMIFPIGELTKAQTRAEGRRLAVPGWDKPDSVELCFIPDGDVGSFIERRRGLAPTRGDIIDESGAALGEHRGVYRYTVGQRRGLNLGGQSQPKYVLSVIPEESHVIVGPAESLLSRSAEVTAARWLREPSGPVRAEVQVRSRHHAAPALVEPRPGGFRVTFDEPQRAVAPGQAAVVYLGDEVLGGGDIESAEA